MGINKMSAIVTQRYQKPNEKNPHKTTQLEQQQDHMATEKVTTKQSIGHQQDKTPPGPRTTTDQKMTIQRQTEQKQEQQAKVN